MPTVTITWDDINDNEDGFNIYRDTVPLDTANPANLPAPLATVAAGIGTYDDTTAAADTTYYYAVAATKGTFVNAAAGVQVDTAALPLAIDTATLGDEVEGGVYAGINTESDNTQYHIIFALQAGELAPADGDTRWKTSRTTTPGTTSATDGWANTQAMEAAGLADHPAALYCRDYVGGGYNDWHMPAIAELRLEENIRNHPEMSVSTGDLRWASTEISNSLGSVRRFSDGEEYTGSSKDQTGRRVRPVRRIPVNP